MKRPGLTLRHGVSSRVADGGQEKERSEEADDRRQGEARMTTATSDIAGTRIGHLRYSIVAMLFAVTIVNYADRATIAIAGPVLSKELGFSPVQMGFIFSAFGWSYVIGQIPGGWLLDRFGSKAVYFVSIFTWSLFTLLQGAVGLMAATLAFYALF